MSWTLWVIIGIVTVFLGGMILWGNSNDREGTSFTSPEDSPWILVEEGLVWTGVSRIRIATIKNESTGKCYLTKDSSYSGLIPVDCPVQEVK